MKSHTTTRALLGLCASLALLTPIAAHAAPALLIDKPGTYVMDKDMMVADGDAIMITATGVTLDLNGHTVSVATPGKGRGIIVQNAKGVRIRNGQVGSFAVDMLLEASENVTVEGMQIVGANLPFVPSGTQNPGDPRATGGPGFSEVGVLLVNTRGAIVRDNTITSVSAGIFNRGSGSVGSVFEGNTITGGATAANNSLGICFNPLPNEGDNAPSACLIKGNHIARYGIGTAWQGLVVGNIVKENTLVVSGDAYFFPGANKDANTKATLIAEDNTVVKISP